MSERGYARFQAGETRAYATATTPAGIFRSILAAAEYHGVSREQLGKPDDLDKIEKAFAQIDEFAFRRLLNSIPFNPLQIALVGALESVEPRSTAPTRDPGSQLGRVA